MEVPPCGPPPANYQDSPAYILMQMKNSDERGPSSPTPHKLSYLLSQSPPQGMHPQLPPPSSFNFMPNFVMTPPPINPMNPMNNMNMANMNNPPLRMSIPRLSLPVARPSSAPGSPHTPNTPTSQQNSTPTTPISSPKETRKQADCKLKHCLLCERGQPSLLVKAPTWASIMRVVFYCLKFDMNEKQYFSLKTDVYSFMLAHWDKLCLNKKKSDNWHKQIQDMLSHSKNLFESGMDKYKQNGFWRLKTLTDPWTITKDRSPRKSSDPPARDPTGTYGSSDEDISEQEADGDRVMDRSPKRVKMSMELTEEEPASMEDVERQRKLESEVSNLRMQLSSMSDTLVGLKEELKQREDSLQTQREAYEKLTEEFCVLQIIAQREANNGNGGFKLPPATSTANLINNIIHANQYHGSDTNSNPFAFTPQELRKLEELKRAEDIRKGEEIRKIDEIRAAIATGSLPMHKLEELRSMGYTSNLTLAPKQVEELRAQSPRTPRDASPRDMSRDPSPRADALLATSPREMIMRDGSPRTEVLLRNAANEAFLREAQRESMQRESIMREAAQRSESLIRDSTRIVKRGESPRLSPRGSPRTAVHPSSHATPGSPLANHVRDAPYSRPESHTPSSLNLNSPRDVLLATSNLSLNSPRGVIHDINSPRDVLHATSNLSLNSPRDILNNSGNSVNSNSNVPPSSNSASSSSTSGFFFSQSAPATNSPRDLLSINNILNSNPSSSQREKTELAREDSNSSSSSNEDAPPSKYSTGPQVPHINLRNLHHLSSPSPPSSPSTSSTSILSNTINNLNLSDGIEMSSNTTNNSNTPNRLSPLHQVLPQYIPKSRSPTHEQASASAAPSSPMLIQLQQMQLHQHQQQLLQQQAQQQQQLQQLHQQYQYQLQQAQQQQLQQLHQQQQQDHK